MTSWRRKVNGLGYLTETASGPGQGEALVKKGRTRPSAAEDGSGLLKLTADDQRKDAASVRPLLLHKGEVCRGCLFFNVQQRLTSPDMLHSGKLQE